MHRFELERRSILSDLSELLSDTTSGFSNLRPGTPSGFSELLSDTTSGFSGYHVYRHGLAVSERIGQLDADASNTQAAESVSSSGSPEAVDLRPVTSNAEMSKVITEEGGEIQLERYAVKVIIPSNAVESPVEVSIKLLTDTSKLYIREGEILTTFGVQCGPDGQTFKKPVCVILPHSAVSNRLSNLQVVLHCIEFEEGRNEEIITRIPLPTSGNKCPFCKVKQNTIELHIDHFSGFWATVKSISNRIWSAFFGSPMSGKDVKCSPFSRLGEVGETQYLRLHIYDQAEKKGLEEDIKSCEVDMDYKRRHFGVPFTVTRDCGPVTVDCEVPNDRPPPDVTKQTITEKDVFSRQANLVDFWWRRGQSGDVSLTVRQESGGEANMLFDIPLKPSGPHETPGEKVIAERNRLDEAICTLAKEFPPGKFVDLCDHPDVKIGYDTQNQILIKHNRDYGDAARNVLHIWKNKTEGANVEGLKRILRDIDLGGKIGILQT